MLGVSARLVGRSLWLAAPVLALTCQTCSPAEPPASDTGAPGIDAHTRDVAVDGAETGTPADADDAAQAGDPGWVHFPDAPADCATYEIAGHPENVAPAGPESAGDRPVPLLDCGTGCRRSENAFYGATDAFRVDGRTVVILGSAPRDVHEFVRAMVDLDHGTLAAVRYSTGFVDRTQPLCTTDHFGANGTDVAFELNYARYDSTGSHVLEAWVRLYRARYNDVLGTARRLNADVASAGSGGSIVATVALGPDLASYQQTQAISVAEADGSTRNVSGAIPLQTEAPFHVGSDILFDGLTLDSSPRGVLARSAHGADATIIREVTGGGLANFATDGAYLAWLEGVGYDATTGRFASLTLWSGTYDGTLHASQVRDMAEFGPAAAVGGGYYAQTEHDTVSGRVVYAIYRLSDGARAMFNPLEHGLDVQAETVALVTADEILLETSGILWRIDPAALAFR